MPKAAELKSLVDSDDSDDSDDEQVATKGGLSPKVMGVAVLTWLVVGVLAFEMMGFGGSTGSSDGASFLTALYVIVQVITTIGYGDICPQSEAMKLCTAFYVLIGIFMIAGVFSKISEAAMEKSEELFRSQLRKAQAAHSGESQDEIKAKKGSQNQLLAAAALFAFFILAGTLFYGNRCTCSYGRTLIAGTPAVAAIVDPANNNTVVAATPAVPCDPTTYETCIATGGAHRTYIDSFYMSCVTLTTVGFGDYSPKSVDGRIFGIFWMLFGVCATGNFVTAVTTNFLEQSKDAKKVKLTQALFDKIDVDKSGYLSEFEFVSYILIQHGKVSQADIDAILAEYKELDTNGDGTVSYEDMKHLAG